MQALDHEPGPRPLQILPPMRGEPFEDAPSQVLDVALAEYAGLRGEIDTSLANQLSILSFGAATIGLLVTAGATLWGDVNGTRVAAVMYAVVVPLACFLVMAIWLGELTRMLRAGLFMLELEKWINACLPRAVLAWEHWGEIRRDSADLEGHNRRIVALVFLLLALAGVAAGMYGLDRSNAGVEWLVGTGTAAGATVVLGGAWLLTLLARGDAYREAYAIPPLKDGRLQRDEALLSARMPNRSREPEPPS
jgi:hypothetical protein